LAAYGTRMRPSRPALAGALAFACALDAGLASATPEAEGVDVRIECPGLDDSAQAALEARARAALALRAGRAGTMAVSCGERTATLTWSPVADRSGTRTLELAQDGLATVDALLGALDELLAEQAERTAAPVKDEDGAAPPDTVEPTTVEAASVPRFGVVAGADGELWAGRVPVALGGHAGLRARVAGSWSAWLTGGLVWGSSSPQGIHGRAVRAGLGLDDRIGEHVRLGAGAAVTVLFADGVVGGTPVSGKDWSIGATASAAYVISMGPIAICAGPEVEWLATPIAVHSPGGEVFRIPSFTGGLSLEVDGRVAQ
jgi:hypothetical protein